VRFFEIPLISNRPCRFHALPKRFAFLAILALCAASPAWSQDEQPLALSKDASVAASAPHDGPEMQVGVRLNPQSIKAKYDVGHIGDRGVGKGMNFYSLERERALGKDLADSIEVHARLIKDRTVTEYINRVGQNIVRNSDAQVPFVIKVINDDEVNAFALPGGYFYVNSGLILAVENEAELAGVMAHEIAHVAARHATRNATKGELWNMASIPLIFAGGPVGFAVRQVASLAVPMSFLKFSRDAEREADLLGLEYGYASGYDPAAYVQLFERLSAKEKHKPGFLAKAFATHPMSADRVRRAQEEIQTLLPARDQYVVNTSEFDEVKARLSALLNLSTPAANGFPVLRKSSSDGGGDRPTLHKRPEPDPSSAPPQTDDGPPTLKRRSPLISPEPSVAP
jgi:predicted Zn-dependent protease